jgi:hypothetical protein
VVLNKSIKEIKVTLKETQRSELYIGRGTSFVASEFPLLKSKTSTGNGRS